MEIEKYLELTAKQGDNPDDYAYTPDKSNPSSFKLRIDDAAHVGGAVAALGPGGFRGNKVQIPADALAGVKRKVRAAWHKFHPDASAADVPEVLKGDSSMTLEELTVKLGEMETQLGDATKRADRAEAILKMSPDDRAVFEKLPADKQDGFIQGDVEARKAFYPQEPTPDPAIQKRLDDIQKALDTANARADAAEVIAKAERSERQKVEFQKKAEILIPNLPGTAEEKGAALQSVHSKLSKEEVEKLETLLKAGDAALKQLGVPRGAEVPGAGGGDAWSKIENLAKSLVAKDSKLTQAKAIERVLQENPGLYNEYLEGQPKQ